MADERMQFFLIMTLWAIKWYFQRASLLQTDSGSEKQGRRGEADSPDWKNVKNYILFMVEKCHLGLSKIIILLSFGTCSLSLVTLEGRGSRVRQCIEVATFTAFDGGTWRYFLRGSCHPPSRHLWGSSSASSLRPVESRALETRPEVHFAPTSSPSSSSTWWGVGEVGEWQLKASFLSTSTSPSRSLWRSASPPFVRTTKRQITIESRIDNSNPLGRVDPSLERSKKNHHLDSIERGISRGTSSPISTFAYLSFCQC